MPQTLIKGQGGTVEAYFLDRQVSSCSVSIYSGFGSPKVSAAAGTVDSVSTTLSGAAARGASTLSVASAAGIVVGRRYLLGGIADVDPAEAVTVRDVTGTTVTPFAPLAYAHATGATLKGTRVSLVVTGVQADALWWDGYADFVPASGDTVTEVVDCVLRKIADPLIDETDVYLVFPKARKILDAELDWKAALDEARAQFIQDLGGKFRAHCMLGTEHMRRACSLAFWLCRRHSLGAEWAAMVDAIERDYEREVVKLQGQIPVDNDQDGVTQGVNDGGYTVITLDRA